jgi:hypothetical protein
VGRGARRRTCLRREASNLRRVSDRDAAQDMSLRVSILPGVPGIGAEIGAFLPSSAQELAEALESRGVMVVMPSDSVESIELRGDLLLPILEFASGVATGALGQLVADAVSDLVRRRKPPPTRVHLRVLTEEDGDRVTLDIEGSGAQVVRALRDLQ